MNQFRRALRWFFTIIGVLFGLATAAAAFFARNMISPPRQRLWVSPADIGLDYEEVEFPAYDGVRLSGWFIPAVGAADAPLATIVLVHGWQWNRLGYAGEDLMANVMGGTAVEFLRFAYSLQKAGYNVLTFDLRNHGQSASSRPVTFGQAESKDLLGALNYLNGRDDVDNNRIGVIGFSMGATTVLYALPQTSAIRAAVAVQPVTPGKFARQLTTSLFGAPGNVIRILAELIYQIFGGPRLSGLLPAFVVSGAGSTPVLFVQGKGDPWGSVEDVSQMAQMTPCAQQLLIVSSQDRFEGYQYIIDNPKVVTAFFKQHLA